MAWNRYKKYRKQLLETDPYCYRCGVEHGVGHDALEYHHLTPQYLGDVDHELGVLLCRRCHILYSTEQRNAHKQVVDGLKVSDNYVFRAGKKNKLRRTKRIEELINAWRE